MNEDGGKWVASYPKAQRDSFEEQWLWTMLAVIGGAWGGEGTPCAFLLWVCLSARRLLVVGGFSPFVAFVALTSWFNLIRALFCFVVNMNFAQSNEKTHVFHPPPPPRRLCDARSRRVWRGGERATVAGPNCSVDKDGDGTRSADVDWQRVPRHPPAQRSREAAVHCPQGVDQEEPVVQQLVLVRGLGRRLFCPPAPSFLSGWGLLAGRGCLSVALGE